MSRSGRAVEPPEAGMFDELKLEVSALLLVGIMLGDGFILPVSCGPCFVVLLRGQKDGNRICWYLGDTQRSVNHFLNRDCTN